MVVTAAICKNILSDKHIMLECSMSTELLKIKNKPNKKKKKKKKKNVTLNACKNVRYILYNTDVINYIVKLIVHSPVGKLA